MRKLNIALIEGTTSEINAYISSTLNIIEGTQFYNTSTDERSVYKNGVLVPEGSGTVDFTDLFNLDNESNSTPITFDGSDTLIVEGFDAMDSGGGIKKFVNNGSKIPALESINTFTEENYFQAGVSIGGGLDVGTELRLQSSNITNSDPISEISLPKTSNYGILPPDLEFSLAQNSIQLPSNLTNSTQYVLDRGTILSGTYIGKLGTESSPSGIYNLGNVTVIGSKQNPPKYYTVESGLNMDSSRLTKVPGGIGSQNDLYIEAGDSRKGPINSGKLTPYVEENSYVQWGFWNTYHNHFTVAQSYGYVGADKFKSYSVGTTYMSVNSVNTLGQSNPGNGFLTQFADATFNPSNGEVIYLYGGNLYKGNKVLQVNSSGTMTSVCYSPGNTTIYTLVGGILNYTILGTSTYNPITSSPTGMKKIRWSPFNNRLYYIDSLNKLRYITITGTTASSSTLVHSNAISDFCIDELTGDAYTVRLTGSSVYKMPPEGSLTTYLSGYSEFLAESNAYVGGKIFMNSVTKAVYVTLIPATNSSITEVVFTIGDQNYVGEANSNAGDLILVSGLGNGTGRSRIQLKTGNSTTPGTTAQVATTRVEITELGHVIFHSIPTAPDNATAISNGLAINTMYKTATGDLKIVV